MTPGLFTPGSVGSGGITPRPYQAEALEALDLHMRTKETHPCVVIPTGGGKSILMAWAIQSWKRDYPPFRCCVLAHRKELVEQNAAELRSLWPGGDIGIYSAGLSSRHVDRAITFASIDSVFRRWGEFPPLDVLIIDEAHRIPARGEGKYRTFINGCRKSNPSLRVIGFTATPFRMGCGPICHKDHILNEVCYEANVGTLIAQGFLCRLRSKIGDVQADISNVERNHGGDYKEKSLAAVMDAPDIVRRAVQSAMAKINAENRKSCIFFCVDVKHCHDVSNELRKYGIEAPCVTAKTPAAERDRIAKRFKQGGYRAICNVNVYTEGFNAERVDAIVLLRPTLSPGLYVQMVGRGLRLHPSKIDCLVLDYGHCIETHGPIDCMDAGEVRLIDCGNCGDTFSRAIRSCPHCGWEIPKQEIERAEAVEREKAMHAAEAAQRAILGGEPETLTVDDVTIARHRKPGSPDSMRVQYRCGLSAIREWICLDHPGYPGRKARDWWAQRFSRAEAAAITLDKAVDDFFTAGRIKAVTESITVIRRGKYQEITSHKLTFEKGRNGNAASR
jgi:DNA repair protein RadD